MSGRRSPRDTSQVSAVLTGGESASPAAAIESSTAADRSSGRKSSRAPSRRGVVRRSEPLRELAPSYSSSETGASAPASTGDTSLLVEQPTVRELVLAGLSGTDKRVLLEGGTPHHELSCTSGRLRPEVTLRRPEILVTQYTPAAWRSQVAWHTYWDEHGGFGGADLGNEQVVAGSPPTPRREHRKVRVTWGQARRWVREEAGAGKASSDTSRAAASGPGRRGGLPARTRHDLDRTAQRLRDRFASRPARRGPADPKWAWTNTDARACEASIREALGDATRPAVGIDSLERRARAAIATAHRLLGSDATAAFTPAADTGCAWCGGPLPKGLRPEAKFCSKRCRQAASRARLKSKPPAPPSPPPQTCAWCGGPMPAGLRREARYCGKRCRQGSSRFGLAVKRTAPTTARARGPSDASPPSPTPAETTRRRRAQRKVLDDTSRAMRFAYADPPYPGRAHYYPEQTEVDHRALVERLVREYEDGWAVSTSAEALQEILALCPAGVRVCAWQRAVRPTRSRRPISAWEPLIVYRGRELPLDEPQTVHGALAYGGRYRTFPGAIVGMKPPQFAVWMFQQLGARPGDQLVDLYPGSGAIAEAWRRYAGTLATTGQSDGTAELQAGVDARHVAARAESEHAVRASDLAVVCREQGDVSGERSPV